MEDPNSLPPPPGFIFQPTDEDLLNYYLRIRHLQPPSCPSSPLLQNAIKDFNIYGCDPKNLSDAACLLSADGEKRWFFFTPRVQRKLADSGKRKARGGYWRRKGRDRLVVSGKGGGVLGVKKKYVFYRGAFPRLSRTCWVMHEYELADSDFSPSKESFALCCVFLKTHVAEEKQVVDSCDEFVSAAANHNDVDIAFKHHDQPDKLSRFLMELPEEHNGVLAGGPIDNDFPSVAKFPTGLARDDTKYAINKLFETALIEGDFIELNDLLSPLPDGPLGRDENRL